MDELKKLKWDRKYQNRKGVVSPPESFLVNHIDILIKGSVLDIACGDGRNSLFLARKGLDVTGIDFSEEGLKRLEQFAKAANLPIQTMEMDAESKAALMKLGKFNNVVAIRYKPSEKILQLLPQLLHPNGVLLFYTFNWKQATKKGFPRKFCLEENELVNSFTGMELLIHQSLIEKGDFLDGYLFKKGDSK